ncbi:hypothetical protein AJ79_09674 [Helicocarpus griseus UAMH5409]|uniref:Uncharacterized protein n=1 Tax=Helicocarpus griseus UAMH5409 TaxID=1447875 RepID=A0A2B7WHH3_9EURO|nr:hypothetical protein AJ79_09674 [Helicocarpus griseus UAMH5409]
MAMIRLRPTRITLSGDEVYSCVQRILVARVLQTGRDQPASSERQHGSSSDVASLGSPYFVPDSSSFEDSIYCDPEDCDSSPAILRNKREASSSGSRTEPPPADVQESISVATDAQLAEHLDTITLNFTSYLSPSTWLGPFALPPGPIDGYMCEAWNSFKPTKSPDETSITISCQRKLPEPWVSTGISPLLPARGSPGTPPIPLKSQEGSSSSYTLPNVIMQDSLRCSSPCCQIAASAPSVSYLHDTDSEDEDQEDNTLTNLGLVYTGKFKDASYYIDGLCHLARTTAVNNSRLSYGRKLTANGSLNINHPDPRWSCLKAVQRNSHSYVLPLCSCNCGLYPASPSDMTPICTYNIELPTNCTTNIPEPPENGRPFAISVHSNIATDTDHYLLVAPKPIADNLGPHIQKLDPETFGVPEWSSQLDTYFIIPGITVPPRTAAFPITLFNRPPGAIPPGLEGFNYALNVAGRYP